MRPIIVFDLDGTLVDTLPDLRASLNRRLSAAGLAPFEPAEVAPLIGDGAAALVRRAAAGADGLAKIPVLAAGLVTPWQSP